MHCANSEKEERGGGAGRERRGVLSLSRNGRGRGKVAYWHAAMQGVSECAGTGSCLLSGGLWCVSSGEPEWNLKHSKDWCW